MVPATSVAATQSNPMTHEETIAEVEGAKSATTIASSDDASTAHLHTGGGEGGGTATHHGETSTHAAESPRPSDGELRVISGGAVEREATPKPAARAREAADDQDEEDVTAGAQGSTARAQRAQGKKHTNNLRKLRIERMMSKAELARRANLSVLTIDRIEKGFGCRMDSKRKILEALGLSLADRVRVFGEEE
jgi:DNA-binding XRE family transcriptional regulator